MKRYKQYIISLICIAFVIVFLIQVFYEGVLKIPVVIRPKWGDIFETGNGDFDWNYLVGVPKGKQTFRLQIASDSGFKDIIINRTIKDTHVHISRAFLKRGPYYFRLQGLIDGMAHGWTRPKRFYGAGIEGG